MSDQLGSTEKKILFELEAINHLLNEMSQRMARIVSLTSTGEIPQEQQKVLESLACWQELFRSNSGEM